MSKDTIYREDAIKALRLEYPMMPMFKELREEWAVKTEGYRKAEEVITRLPSADRPQGEWIYHKEILLDEEYYPSRFECDQCHHYVIAGNDRNFCPNCGAKMKGAGDE